MAWTSCEAFHRGRPERPGSATTGRSSARFSLSLPVSLLLLSPAELAPTVDSVHQQIAATDVGDMARNNSASTSQAASQRHYFFEREKGGKVSNEHRWSMGEAAGSRCRPVEICSARAQHGASEALSLDGLGGAVPHRSQAKIAAVQGVERRSG